MIAARSFSGADTEALGDISRAGAQIALLGEGDGRGVEHFAIAVLPLRADVGPHVRYTHSTHEKFLTNVS